MTRPVEEYLPSPGAGGGIVRVGDTIRRSQAKTPEAMGVVLRHLERVGFGAAPRLLGTDEQGRRVLSYLDGEVAQRPYPAWSASDGLLASVARLLRRYHEAVADLRPPPGIPWRTVPPPEFSGCLVGHMDVSLANVVCRSGTAIGLIDFEEVGPAAAIWDVARTVRHWVPLIDPVDLVDSFAAVDGRQGYRLRLFADEYGLSIDQRDRLVDAVLVNADESHERMRQGAVTRHPGYLLEWHGGAAARNRRGRDWVAGLRSSLTAALTHPGATVQDQA